MSPPSVNEAAPTLPTHLHVRAGGAVLAVSWDLLAEARAAGPLTPIPGAPPWLSGLTQWKGRLMTVVDAGRLFGNGPTSGRWLLALRGLACEVALGVDELLGSPGADETAGRVLDRQALAGHPAFQPGAAGPGLHGER